MSVVAGHREPPILATVEAAEQLPQIAPSSVKIVKLSKAKEKSMFKSGLAKVLGQFVKNFHKWDANGNGSIDSEEFALAVRALRLPGARDASLCGQVFDEIDIDLNGSITCYECLRYAVLQVLQLCKERVQNLCKLWDIDSSNTINKEEFSRVIEALGLDVPQAITDAVFRELDGERTGELVYAALTQQMNTGKTVSKEPSASTPSTSRSPSPSARHAVSAMAVARRLKQRPRTPIRSRGCSVPSSAPLPLQAHRAPPTVPVPLASMRPLWNRPSSPSGSSDSSEETQHLDDGPKLAGYLNSKRLELAEALHLVEQRVKVREKRLASEAAAQRTPTSHSGAWPAHRTHSMRGAHITG